MVRIPQVPVRAISPTTINLPAELKQRARELSVPITPACIDGLERGIAIKERGSWPGQTRE